MKNLFRKVALLGSFAFAATHVQAANIKVGTVDLQRALQESKKGKASNGTFEKEMKDREKKFKAEQDAVKKAVEEFQKKSAVLSEKARNEQGAALQQRIATIQEMGQKFQLEMQSRQADLVKPIIEGLRNLVPDIAKQKSLDVVLEASSGGLLYAVDKVDLTDDLIKLYDSKN